MDRMKAGQLLFEALERAWPEYETWDEIAAEHEFYAEVAEDFLGNLALAGIETGTAETENTGSVPKG